MPPITQHIDSTERALRMLRNQGPVVHTADALDMGIHPRALYKLRDTGALERLSRGVYRIADTKPLEYPDLVTVAARCPKAVVCLISALSYHQLTTQIPHSVSIALPQGSAIPRIDHPPVSVYHFSPKSYESGIEDIDSDGVTLRIYNPEKTIADCFKFRNKIGMDVVLESLKMYREDRKYDVHSLLRYGKVCRVDTIMKPYLEALL